MVFYFFAAKSKKRDFYSKSALQLKNDSMLLALQNFASNSNWGSAHTKQKIRIWFITHKLRSLRETTLFRNGNKWHQKKTRKNENLSISYILELPCNPVPRHGSVKLKKKNFFVLLEKKKNSYCIDFWNGFYVVAKTQRSCEECLPIIYSNFFPVCLFVMCQEALWAVNVLRPYVRASWTCR